MNFAMAAEFKTLWELNQAGTFKHLADSARGLVNFPTLSILILECIVKISENLKLS